MSRSNLESPLNQQLQIPVVQTSIKGLLHVSKGIPETASVAASPGSRSGGARPAHHTDVWVWGQRRVGSERQPNSTQAGASAGNSRVDSTVSHMQTEPQSPRTKVSNVKHEPPTYF